MSMSEQQPSGRIEALKRRAEQGFSETMFVKRKEVYERIFAENRSEPRIIRVAKALAAFLHEKEIPLWSGDLLAGHAQYCDYTLSYPPSTADEIQTLRQAADSQNLTAEEASLLEQFGTGSRIGLFYRAPSGHVIAGYDRVLARGLGSFAGDARARLASCEGPERDFAAASLIACEAGSAYILRYGTRAEAMAASAGSVEEQEQLERMAAACRWIAFNPPRSFFEAVQLLWLIHEIIIYEQFSGSLSLGRLDQYLYPYYAKDLAAGLITRAEAGELIEALWLKFSGLRRGFQHVVLGGSGRDSEDEANDLSFICLQATKKLRQDQPLISVRWHRGMRDEFWREIQSLLELGLGFPALFNEEIAVAAKRRLGVTQKDAEDFAVIGCVELAVPGKEFAHTEGFRLSWAKVLELMFHGGRCPITGEIMPLKHPRNLAGIESFTEFYQWYKDELSYFLDLGIRGLNVLDRHYAEYWPDPFLSSTMDGCLANGRDATAGGTIYNFSSVNGCGMANVADSLAAIERVVFAEKKISLPELAEAMRRDFQGLETLRAELVTKSPKFGNDEDEPDMILAELAAGFCRQVESYRNPRGGRFQTGLYTVEAHAIMGKRTGALPDGHRRGQALANALSPVQGADVHGPTAVIKSIAKLDHRLLGNGMVLDLKFHAVFFADDRHRQAFRTLIETYFQLGGLEIQFNIISRRTLQEAQASPEKYRHLLVRVSGFSAYFVELDPSVQDEIIARTEFAAI
ncbi:MAG: pyruvate formate lyase family protein [Bacteroidota bacterium]